MKLFKVITTEEEWREELSHYDKDWYHTWDYHQIAFKSDEGSPVLFVLTDGAMRIALPLLVRDIGIESSYKDMTSVYGYPGFLFFNEESYELYDCFIKELKRWSRDNSIVSIFSRLNTLTCKDVELEGQFINGETIVVDLSLSENEQKSLYRKNYRNLIRRLEKDGFTVDWSNEKDSIDDFKRIYKETMESLNASDYYYFDDAYYDFLINSKDFKVRIYNVWLEGVKTCSGIFVFCNNIVQYHLSGTLQAYKDLAPTRMLIDAARKDATKLGYKFLHLGGGVGSGRDNLFNFKYGFSKNPIDFKVFKMVTNVEAYRDLSNLSATDDVSLSGYFPLYRKG